MLENRITHLVQPAPVSTVLLLCLQDALDHSLAYCIANKTALEYFTFGILVVEDQRWDVNGIKSVHVDFEESFAVTNFRLKAEDVASCCASLKDEDVSAEENGRHTASISALHS